MQRNTLSFKFQLCHQHSAVTIATRYGLDGPGSNPGKGEIFLNRPDRPWEPTTLPYNGYRVSCPGVNRSGRYVYLPPPSSAKVKERVQLYLYSPLWAFVVCSRVNIIFTFTTSFLLRGRNTMEWTQLAQGR